MDIPENLRYTAEHEWILADGGSATVGITAFAAERLGDIVFLELPRAGDPVEASQPCGEIESTKSVTDVYSPATGEVVEVNHQAVDDPSLVNTDPYGAGWLFRMAVDGEYAMLSADEYAQLVQAGE